MGCKHLLSLPWMTFSTKGEQASWSREKSRTPENAFSPLCFHREQAMVLPWHNATYEPLHKFTQASLPALWGFCSNPKEQLCTNHIPKHPICFLLGSGWKDAPRTAMSWGAEALAPQISGKAPCSSSVVCSISSNTPFSFTKQLPHRAQIILTNHCKWKPLYLLPILLLLAGF